MTTLNCENTVRHFTLIRSQICSSNSGGTGGGHIIYADGVEMPQQPGLDFLGASGTDNPGITTIEGLKGDTGTGTVFRGSDTWANIDAIASPEQNDAWALTEATGAPVRPDASPAGVGDWVVWDGAAWANIGPHQGEQGEQGTPGADGLDGAQGATGPEGPEGPEGAVGPAGAEGPVGPVGPEGPEGPIGAGTQFLGTQDWSYISGLSDQVQGDMWVLANATGAPTNPSGEPAVTGDRVVWTGAAWDNVGAGEAGPPGADGVDGVDGVDGATGPPGPSAVSAAADNYAYIHGSDSLIYVPTITAIQGATGF